MQYKFIYNPLYQACTEPAEVAFDSIKYFSPFAETPIHAMLQLAA
jgi:hypothetical protein